MWFSDIHENLQASLHQNARGRLHPDAPFYHGLPGNRPKSDAIYLVDETGWNQALEQGIPAWHVERLSLDRPRAVLFDLDGTLIDSFDGIVSTFLTALGEMEITGVEPEEIRSLIGIPLEECFAKFMAPSRAPEAVERYRFHYKAQMHNISPAFPGAPDLLMALRSAGILTGIVSNKRAGAVRELLAHKDWSLDVIRGEGEGIRAKPDPGLLWDACRHLGVSEKETLYVGDSVVDAMAAQAAGTAFIGVTTGAHSGNELGAEAWGVFPSIEEVGRAFGFRLPLERK